MSSSHLWVSYSELKNSGAWEKSPEIEEFWCLEEITRPIDQPQITPLSPTGFARLHFPIPSPHIRVAP